MNEVPQAHPQGGRRDEYLAGPDRGAARADARVGRVPFDGDTATSLLPAAVLAAVANAEVAANIPVMVNPLQEPETAVSASDACADLLDTRRGLTPNAVGQHGLRLLAQSIASAYLLCEQINRRGLRFAANGCTQEDSIEANRTLNTQTRAISVLGGLVLELLKYGQPATQTVVYKHVSIEAGAQAMLGPAQPRRSAVRDGKGRVTGRNER